MQIQGRICHADVCTFLYLFSIIIKDMKSQTSSVLCWSVFSQNTQFKFQNTQSVKVAKGSQKCFLRNHWHHKHSTFGLTWRKLSVPNGVWIGCICGSSVSNICWMRDSLLSSGLCHDTWSPLQNVFSAWENKKDTFIFQLKSCQEFCLSPVSVCRGHFQLPEEGDHYFSIVRSAQTF